MKNFLLTFASLFLFAGIASSEPVSSNRVHRQGKIWLNLNNRAAFGNAYSIQDQQIDPETNLPAPSCEFPGGSGAQYLFHGSLWIGALIDHDGFDEPRVSVANDGWLSPDIKEFASSRPIVERTSIPGIHDYLNREIFSPDAKAHQEYLTSFTDTLVDRNWVSPDPIDGNHSPLGIEVTETTRQWGSNGIDEFILIDLVVRNIGSNRLKNLYVGYMMDADIGVRGSDPQYFTDDITGFRPWHYFDNGAGIDSIPMLTAWAADNDGRVSNSAAGNEFASDGIIGMSLLGSDNPRINTSYNWWSSNSNSELDYGPSWVDDNAPQNWTTTFGTPMGDSRKYFLMQNRENDFDNVYLRSLMYIPTHPQIIRDENGNEIERHAWKALGEGEDVPDNLDYDLANGFDAKFLISWGPVGIFDHIDEANHRIYRLNPGETCSLSVALLCGSEFHSRNNPQPDNSNINHELFDFSSLSSNFLRAKALYNARYIAPHPPTPPNFRATAGFHSVVLEWESLDYLEGTIIDIFRRSAGVDSAIKINSSPLLGNYYVDSTAVVGTEYFYSAEATRFDTLKSLRSDEVRLLPGQPARPSSLSAVAGNGIVTLSWNASADAKVTGYEIFRLDEDGNESRFTTGLVTSYEDRTATNGIPYHYEIRAINRHGTKSEPRSVGRLVLPMGFTKPLLVILSDLRANRVYWDTSRVNDWTRSTFRSVVPGVEFTSTTPDSIDLLRFIADYKMVWIVQDNSVQNLLTQEDIYDLDRYVEIGKGKLVLSGREILGNLLGSRTSVWQSKDDLPFSIPFGFDSLYAANWPLDRPEVMSLSAEQGTFAPQLTIEQARANQVNFTGDGTLPSVDGLRVSVDAKSLYRIVSIRPDSSVLHSASAGVIMKNDSIATALLTFPLYGVGPDDSVKVLVNRIFTELSGGTHPGDMSPPEVATMDGSLEIVPNPFNSRTTIRFEMRQSGKATLKVFDLTGREVLKLEEARERGTAMFTISAGDLATGSYLVRVETPEGTFSGKFSVLK